ncbi:MAG: DNA methyltransferase C1 [Termitinemataceae bacterium]|nr:MAG: DNA methyltransferase C1 [Termitinemataceae bacterium]
MKTIDDIQHFDFDTVPVDTGWNFPCEKELKIHRIHAYPAKFPAFVTTKAIEYARKEQLKTNAIADIFCGCGTTAFEAKRNNINYWGCDINPVATMIARVKSKKYQLLRLQKYYQSILDEYENSQKSNEYENANERLKYWYTESQYNNLAHLKSVILKITPNESEYCYFFLCAFSNILKASSKWLTKSIKPQVDPNKKILDVYSLFKTQCQAMFTANDETQSMNSSKTEIVTGNFLDNQWNIPTVDMIITSPPYVTSYEYADLHQLSTLWLGFTDNYKKLRDGTIGSCYHEYEFKDEISELNHTGENIVSQLMKHQKSKAKSVAKYYLDMQKVAKKVYAILDKQGIALFVIGNTEYKGIRIDNVRHLAESLSNSGFEKICVTKRKISGKILTPYRDANGRFTNDSSGRKIYSEEFILVGRK